MGRTDPVNGDVNLRIGVDFSQSGTGNYKLRIKLKRFGAEFQATFVAFSSAGAGISEFSIIRLSQGKTWEGNYTDGYFTDIEEGPFAGWVQFEKTVTVDTAAKTHLEMWHRITEPTPNKSVSALLVDDFSIVKE